LSASSPGRSTNAVPMITLAPPEEGAGSPIPKAFATGLVAAAAAAGVGPAWKGEAPSEAGAERRRTLIGLWRRRTSVKYLA
jgi:hypothetical protein